MSRGDAPRLTGRCGGLVSGDAVESGGRRDAVGGADIDELTVFLYGKDADGSVSGVERIKEFTVGADGYIEIRCAAGICADDGSGQRSECSVCGDGKARDGSRAGVRDIHEAPVRSCGIPAVSRAECRSTGRDRCKRSVGLNLVGRNCRTVGCAAGAGFGNEREAIGGKLDGEDTRADTGSDLDGRERSVCLHGKDIKIVCLLFRDNQEPAVRAKADRGATWLIVGKEARGIFDRNESALMDLKTRDVAAASRVEGIKQVSVLSDGDRLTAA